MVSVKLITHQTMKKYLQYFQYKQNNWYVIVEKQMTFKQWNRFQNSSSHYTQWDFHPNYQITSHTFCDYHLPKSDQSDSQFKTVTTEIKKQKTVKASPFCKMITINHNLSQCSGHCHFGRFNYDAKAYTADTDIEDSDCSNKKKQIYHTVSNNNSSKESKNEENNSVINFTLLELSQHIHECQQYYKKYLI